MEFMKFDPNHIFGISRNANLKFLTHCELFILCNQLIKMFVMFNINLCNNCHTHVNNYGLTPRLFIPIHRLYPHTTKQETTRPATHNRAQTQSSTISGKQPCHHHQSHLCSWETKVHSLLLNQ